MNVVDILKNKDFTASFEFFPPKNSESSSQLFGNIQELLPLKPGYVSVTYGAGGSTQQLTKDLVIKLKQETDLCIVSHLTCVGHTREEIHKLLEDYDEAGIHNILVLRGDPPTGKTYFEVTPGGFEYAADLLSYIKKHFPHFGCGVAGFPEGHPSTPNRIKEMDYFKRKVDSGADYICTQMFFDNRDYYDFVERCDLNNIKVPVIPGLMPILSKKGMERMAELALGCRFPSGLIKSLSRAQSDDGIRSAGIQWATNQVRDLLDHEVKGIHFYTLNKSTAIKEICSNLGIESL
ncbi:MAG: methylenetetrahydrofolate reductase [NAD(P)H] [Bdellovibrionales bacterium]